MYQALIDPHFTQAEHRSGGAFAAIVWMIALALLFRLLMWSAHPMLPA